MIKRLILKKNYSILILKSLFIINFTILMAMRIMLLVQLKEKLLKKRAKLFFKEDKRMVKEMLL